MNTPGQLSKRIDDLEDEIGKGDIHFLKMEWEDGTPVTIREMPPLAFPRVIADDQDNLQSSIDK